MSTLLRSRFSIDREAVAHALQSLQEWAKLINEPRFCQMLEAETLADALHMIGFDLVEDMHGNVTGIQQHDTDVDTDLHEAAMASLAIDVDDCSFMLFISDDEELFAWNWDGGHFNCYSGGMVVFPHQIKELTDRLDRLMKERL